MFGEPFDNDEIRKYTVLFGNLFNKISIIRTNGDDAKDQRQKVPIAYGGREKYVARVDTDPDIERSVAAQLPRMAYEFIGMNYDLKRVMNPLNRQTSFNDGAASTRFIPAPWNFTFNLYITARHVVDASRIVQQILPWFRPHFTITAQVVEEACSVDLPIVLDAVNMQDNYEGQMLDRRVLIWTLTFTLKGYLYGPSASVEGGIIRWVRVDYPGSTSANSGILLSSNTYPVLANTALEDIEPTDEYTIVTDVTEP